MKKSRYNEAWKARYSAYAAEHYDDVKLRVPKGDREKYKAAAKELGMTLNAFAVYSMNKCLKDMGIQPIIDINENDAPEEL